MGSKGRAGAVATAISGCTYVYGGVDGGEVLSTLECFDADTSKWHPLPAMLRPRKDFVSCGEIRPVLAALSGHLYICGGVLEPGHDRNRPFSSERYDPTRRVWEALPPMATDRSNASVSVLHGCLYVC